MAAQKVNRGYNYQTLDVLAKGEYPADLLHQWKVDGIIPQFEAEDMEYIKLGKMDFLAHSYYMSAPVKAGDESEGISIILKLITDPIKNPYLEQTEWGWTIDPVYSSVDEYFDNMVRIVTKYRHQGDEIAISTNGRMCTDGDTYMAYIMKLLQGINLKQEMEARTGLSVVVLNDGFSAAMGEWWKGAGKGTKNLLVIVLGSGMGSGLVLDGKLYQGSKLNAAMMFGMVNSYGGDKYDLAGITIAFSLLLYQLSALKQIPMNQMTGQKFFEFVAEGDLIATGMLD